MKRIALALSTAAMVGVAAPASAFSIPFELPRLTFPTQPAPDASQGCADLTTLTGDVCAAPAK